MVIFFWHVLFKCEAVLFDVFHSQRELDSFYLYRFYFERCCVLFTLCLLFECGSFCISAWEKWKCNARSMSKQIFLLEYHYKGRSLNFVYVTYFLLLRWLKTFSLYSYVYRYFCVCVCVLWVGILGRPKLIDEMNFLPMNFLSLIKPGLVKRGRIYKQEVEH